MAFQGGILIAIAAWWISGTAPGAEVSLWPAVVFVLALATSFAPFATVLAGLRENTAGSTLVYGLSHLFFTVLFAAFGLWRLKGSAYEYLAYWCFWTWAANAVLWCMLATFVALRRPRV